METPLNNFDFANHSQKQQKAKTVLMLSTVISVFTICHGNHASESPSMLGSLKGFIVLAKQKSFGIVFTHCFLHKEVQKYWMKCSKWLTTSRAGHYNRGVFSTVFCHAQTTLQLCCCLRAIAR
jgi:hypothetical protein